MKIFITGASGYIGGSVAALLASKGHQVRGLVRSPAKAEGVREKGIEPVIGTLDDAALLITEAKAADAVINAADSDHLGAVEALLAGLAGSGKPFIHTSGTSLVGDEAMGEPSDAIFTQHTPVKPEPDKEHRVALNKLIMDAAPGVRTIVLCNSLIYGRTLGAPAQSVQIPPLVAQAKESGVARYIGRGLNIWSNVHIADMADLSSWRSTRRLQAASTMWKMVKPLSAIWSAPSRKHLALATRRAGRPRTRWQGGAGSSLFSRWGRTAGFAPIRHARNSRGRPSAAA